jgi:hypothetical protein
MRRYRPAAALALVAAAAGCNFAARTGIIRKDILTDAQQVVADTKINHGDMTIQGAVDRADRDYDIDQPITLSVTASKDAHIAILRVLANGDTTIIFPNKQHPKADIAANETLTVPGPDDDVKLAVDKKQVVLFEFIASNTPGSWLFTRGPDKDSDFADLGGTTRAIARDITNSLKVGKGPETVASYLTVRVGGGSLF